MEEKLSFLIRQRIEELTDLRTRIDDEVERHEQAYAILEKGRSEVKKSKAKPKASGKPKRKRRTGFYKAHRSAIVEFLSTREYVIVPQIRDLIGEHSAGGTVASCMRSLANEGYVTQTDRKQDKATVWEVNREKFDKPVPVQMQRIKPLGKPVGAKAEQKPEPTPPKPEPMIA